MVEPERQLLPVSRACQLAKISRCGLYRARKPKPDSDAELKPKIEEIGHEVSATAPPSGARESGCDGSLEPRVSIGDDKHSAGQAALYEASDELEPSGRILVGYDANAQDLSVEFGIRFLS